MSGAVFISRADAIAQGLRFYFTGKPCKHGHIAQRVLLGKCGVCVECRKKITRDWREENREAHNSWGQRNPAARKASQDRYAAKHPERLKKARLDWVKRNRDKHRALERAKKKRRRAEDPNWVFRNNLRGRLRKAITRASALKSGKTMDLISCTVAELKAHLQAQFTAGMTWKNYGHGPGRWNVDHRIPCASFDLTDPEQQKRCFHYSNLQPMWHEANVAKGAAYGEAA